MVVVGEMGVWAGVLVERDLVAWVERLLLRSLGNILGLIR